MELIKIKKVVDVITGFPFASELYTNSGIRVVRGENITEGRLRWDTIKCWDLPFDKKEFYSLKEDDVVIGMDGSKVGKNKARIKEKDLPLILAQRVACLRAKESLDQVYLFYCINNVRFEDFVFRIQTGSSIPHISKSQIEDFSIPFPDLRTQKSIAKVLSDLDSKIELNNKINRELEAMAKTLYDYWFVQFDFPCLPSDYRPSGQVNPNNELAQKIKAFSTYTKVGGLPSPDGKQWFVYVILCEDGSFYKGITNDLYRRFYEHYIGDGARWTKAKKPKKIIHWEAFATQSEARQREEELKSGFGRTWLQREYDKLVKYGAVAKDGLPAHQTRLMPAGKMVYNAELKREIPEGWEVKKMREVLSIKNGRDHKHLELGTIPVYGSGGIMRYANSSLYNSESILIPRKGSLGNLFYINEPFWCVDTIFYTQMKFPHTCKYLFYTVQNLNISSMNTGTAVPSMTTEVLNNLSLIFPPMEMLERFDEILSPIFKMKDYRLNENQHLTALRDWLLPMLMNGQVTVRQAHGKLEAEEIISIAAEPSVKYGN